MEGAEEELERRSKFLSSLISKKKATEQQEQRDRFNVRVRASDMPSALQSRAFRCARDGIDSMPGKLDSKTLALALKKEFDLAYGPAWHCIVGTSFGSYVTHSLGGFLYFSIDKLYLPACTGLSPEGVIRAVRTLTKHQKTLEALQLSGIYNITKVHLEALQSCLHPKAHYPQQPALFRNKTINHFRAQNASVSHPPIDVGICPRCDEVRMVFDCPREGCRRRQERWATNCRGCYFCIPRCEECGGCTGDDDPGEAACEDVLCTHCCLHLPKCSFCNKPYCKQHANRGHREISQSSIGFVCDACHAEIIHGSRT